MEFTVACLPIPHFVLLPACTVTLHIGPPALLRQVLLAQNTSGLCCVVEANHYQAGQAPVGCLAEVTGVCRQSTGWNVSLTGLRRLDIRLELQTDKGFLVHCQELPGLPWQGGCLPNFPELTPSIAAMRDRAGASLWLDMAAFHLDLPLAERQRLLAEPDPHRRAQRLECRPAETPQLVTSEARRCSFN